MASNQSRKITDEEVYPGYYNELVLEEPTDWRRLDRGNPNTFVTGENEAETQYEIRVFYTDEPPRTPNLPTACVELYQEERLSSGDPHRGSRYPPIEQILVHPNDETGDLTDMSRQIQRALNRISTLS